MSNNTPQDQAETCRAVATRDGERAGECDCFACATEPAGDLFLDQSEVNPRRRIVRARRPPNMSPATTSANSGGDAAVAAALGSGGNNANRNTNDTPNLSGAIGFLEQLNGPETSDSGVITAGNNNGETTSNSTRSGNVGNTESDNDDDMRRRHLQDDDEDDNEAEDSDDDGSVGPPSRFFQGFLNHMSEMARINASRRPHENLSTKIRPDDDVEDSDEEYEDTAVTCAACYRTDDQSHKWRRLVTLPCCGTHGRETNSSTRFCAACILKLAVTRPNSSNTSEYRMYEDEPDEYPVRKFYQKNVQTNNKRFCECPRCRDILLVKIKGVKLANGDSDDDSSENECDCSDCEAEERKRIAERKDAFTAKSISLHIPSFKAKCLYVGRKRDVAKLLWKVALLHHNFMPFEALGGDEDKAILLRLTGWGVIEKVPGKRNTSLYRIGKENQKKLIKFFRLQNPSEKDEKSQLLLISDIEPCLVYAAW
eukprot:CAMPEP_0201916172 /NCGR_PEP_ID=MMETSP0903-20130614/5873_1 /ASSEMBLY_ACC=CAM_ASM_000552 /TAXON_ID=420261 /ORGANISM="Thalassiosira antarctica, Strain CCMP982" /LENGTH=481 /DNA_ID=CAMNT_0048451923 /DNA_START=121 /DNA_END=1563 /DNA_ORIENTATION=+